MADINTSTPRKIAKTAEIPAAVAKNIVKYRKREAKIHDLNELQYLPGVNKSIFKKICQNLKVIEKTAISPNQEEFQSIPRRKAATDSYVAKLKAKKQTHKSTNGSKAGQRCSNFHKKTVTNQMNIDLPIIAITPEKRQRNVLKTFTPCSVRKSLSGAHIVAVYQAAEDTQENKTNSNSATNDTQQDDLAKLSTQVIPPDSSEYVPKKSRGKYLAKKHASSQVTDPEKVSSIVKWLETVPSPKNRTIKYPQADQARPIAEKTPDVKKVNQQSFKYGAGVHKRNQSTNTHQLVKGERQISDSYTKKRESSNFRRRKTNSPIEKKEQRRVSDALCPASPGVSSPPRKESPGSNDPKRDYRSSISKTPDDHRSVSEDGKQTSVEKHRRSRSGTLETGQREKRRRHLAGDSTDRHRRHSKHRRDTFGSQQGESEGSFCTLL